MSNSTQKELIRTAVRNIVKDMMSISFAYANIVSVDEDKKTCVCKDVATGLEYYDVILSLGAIVPIPSDNALVLLGMTSGKGEASFIIASEKNKKYLISLENGFEMSFNDDGTMTMNGDGCGGLTITPELKKQLENMTKRIDTCLDLLSKATDCTLYPNPAWAAEYQGESALLQKEDFSNIENTKIKHGN